MIDLMRTLTSGTWRLTANTIRELSDALDQLSRRYSPEFKFQGRKLKTGPLLNVIVLHFLLLPEEERRAIVEGTIPKLEELLGSEGDILAFMDLVEQRQSSWGAARDEVAAGKPVMGHRVGKQARKKGTA